MVNHRQPSQTIMPQWYAPACLYRGKGLLTSLRPKSKAWSTIPEHPICVDIRPCGSPHTKVNGNRKAGNWFHSLPSQRFQALLTLFSKFFSSFPHGTCLLSVSGLYLALEDNYPPFSAPLPKYATLCTYTVRLELPQHGTLTLHGSVFQQELSSTPVW